MEELIKINSHGHLLPYAHQIPQFMRDKEVFWIDGEAQTMCQKNWCRPITDPSFFLNEKLEWMDKNDIAHEVILTLSQLYCNGMEQSLAQDVIRFQNDFNAQAQAEQGDKITAGFVVQVAYIDDALREIERCVEELNLQLLCLPTHFLDQNGQWQSVADESVEPIFDLADRYKLAVEIHPYDGPRMIGLADRFWRFHLVWMCAQTADTYHLFTLLNYPERYQGIRTCFAHGNQFGQMNVGRRIQGFEGRPDLFEGAVHPEVALGAANVYFDTLVHDVDSLALLIKRQGIRQILAGLDDPYPLGEMDTVGNCYPGVVIDEALQQGVINQAERQQVWCQNVLDWIGGERSKQIHEILKLSPTWS